MRTNVILISPLSLSLSDKTESNTPFSYSLLFLFFLLNNKISLRKKLHHGRRYALFPWVFKSPLRLIRYSIARTSQTRKCSNLMPRMYMALGNPLNSAASLDGINDDSIATNTVNGWTDDIENNNDNNDKVDSVNCANNGDTYNHI